MSIESSIIKKKLGSAIIPGFFAITDFNNRKERGQNVIQAGAGAAANFAFTEMVGLKGFLALGAVKALPSVAVNTMETLDKMGRSMNNINKNTPFSNMRFNDTQANYTMRQNGMQIAKASRYNLEQTLLGNEAQYLK